MKKICLLTVLCFGVCSIVPCSNMTAETIKIAAIFAKSGDAQFVSPYLFQGVQLAVEELNAQGGLLGTPVEVIELDNKGIALDSKMAALRAVEHDVVAVIGANWSSHSLAMAPVLQQAGIPMISPISTHPDVTRQGNYIFRVCFIDTFSANVLAQFARKDLHAQTAVMLTNVNSDYSIGFSQYFKTSFLQSGGAILWEGKYQQEDTDFTESLNHIKSLQPDVIFLPGYSRESSLVMKQAVKTGIQSIFLNGGSWSIKTFDLAGETIDGSYMADHWHEEGNFPQSEDVLAHYHRKYGETVEASMLLAYDAVMVLADAIHRAQSLERVKIRDALAATKNFLGTTGNITFDEHGDPIDKEVVIVKFEQRELVYVRTMKP